LFPHEGGPEGYFWGAVELRKENEDVLKKKEGGGQTPMEGGEIIGGGKRVDFEKENGRQKKKSSWLHLKKKENRKIDRAGVKARGGGPKVVV